MLGFTFFFSCLFITLRILLESFCLSSSLQPVPGHLQNPYVPIHAGSGLHGNVKNKSASWVTAPSPENAILQKVNVRNFFKHLRREVGSSCMCYLMDLFDFYVF